MTGGGKGARSVGTAALLVLVLLIAATLCAARPGPNPCTNDQNNPGQKCYGPSQQEAAAQSSPAVSVSKASSGSNPCTIDPNDPTGKKCIYPPPLTAP